MHLNAWVYFIRNLIAWKEQWVNKKDLPFRESLFHTTRAPTILPPPKITHSQTKCALRVLIFAWPLSKITSLSNTGRQLGQVLYVWPLSKITSLSNAAMSAPAPSVRLTTIKNYITLKQKRTLSVLTGGLTTIKNYITLKHVSAVSGRRAGFDHYQKLHHSQTTVRASDS